MCVGRKQVGIYAKTNGEKKSIDNVKSTMKNS